jgi:3-methyladenine DNA glycosylase/8-oxoguanine DNA glycosylase
VAWGRGRWPNVDWVDGALTWVGWERDAIAIRHVRQNPGDGTLTIDGASDPILDWTWLNAVLGSSRPVPSFTDPVLIQLASRMPGLRPFANGSLFDGVISSIVGQSISVAAAATTERRLAALVHPGIDIGGRTYYPSPRASDLARLTAAEVRETGVTWRRAEAIAAIARLHEVGEFPDTPCDGDDLTKTRAALRSLPLVGPWTAESALLWGLGMPDIYPSGDVALLRAAKQAYGLPELTMKAMDRLSEGWSPWRSWAARLLWTDLLGPAPVAASVVDA